MENPEKCPIVHLSDISTFGWYETRSLRIRWCDSELSGNFRDRSVLMYFLDISTNIRTGRRWNFHPIEHLAGARFQRLTEVSNFSLLYSIQFVEPEILCRIYFGLNFSALCVKRSKLAKRATKRSWSVKCGIDTKRRSPDLCSFNTHPDLKLIARSYLFWCMYRQSLDDSQM